MASTFNRKKIYDKTNGHCAYCGCTLDFYDFQVDHITPKIKGGSGKFENLNPSCRDCNHFKFDSDLEEFRDKISRIIFDTFHGRIVGKYYGIKEKTIRFYFEQMKVEKGE